MGKLKVGGAVMGQLALSKGPVRLGILYHGKEADIPNMGLSFHTTNTCSEYSNNMYLCVLDKKEIPLSRLKINHVLGFDTCVNSWLTGPHGCKQLCVDAKTLCSVIAVTL